jgi:hypothetical protein
MQNLCINDSSCITNCKDFGADNVSGIKGGGLFLVARLIYTKAGSLPRAALAAC